MKEVVLYQGLPLYNIFVDEELDLEVDTVSIVDRPAIESNFLKFSKQEGVKMIFSSDDKRELLGAALIPDLPIYREMGGDKFYVAFSKETIKKIALNHFKKGYNSSINVEHQDVDAESFIFQSFIVDRSIGVNPPVGLGDIPDGSWIIGVKVNSESLWEDIKSGKRNGFSVEGNFGLEEIEWDGIGGFKKTNKPRPLLDAVREIEALQKAFDAYFSTYDYGCAMLSLKVDKDKFQQKLQEVIPSDIVLEYETSPHITLLYGFLPEVDENEVYKVIEEKTRDKGIQFELGEVSIFENEDTDVVKIDIVDTSGILGDINQALKERFPYENNYPEYIPHLTLAYVNKGEGAQFKGMVINPEEWGIDLTQPGEIVYSGPTENI